MVEIISAMYVRGNVHARYDSVGGDENAALTPSNANCSHQYDLPVLGAETWHHEAEDDEGCACQDECPEIPSVI